MDKILVVWLSCFSKGLFDKQIKSPVHFVGPKFTGAVCINYIKCIQSKKLNSYPTHLSFGSCRVGSGQELTPLPRSNWGVRKSSTRHYFKMRLHDRIWSPLIFMRCDVVCIKVYIHIFNNVYYFLKCLSY
jgi:hypothetical protein